MESINGKPNCGSENYLFKVDKKPQNKISKNMVKSEQENDVPICLKENFSENIEKVSIKSWKDMDKLEPGMTNIKKEVCETDIKKEVCETDDILLKDYRTEETSKNNDIYEQFLSKYEDTVENFYVKNEITEELLIKNEPGIFENDDKVNLQVEQSYNNDVQLLIENKYIPGFPFSTKKGKRCFVPGCENNSIKDPNKIFIHVPNNEDTRSKWYDAVSPGTKVPKTGNLFCCEDHFNMQEDSKNWIYFKTIGARVEIKKEALPRKQPIKNSPILTESEKKWKEENIYCFHKSKRRKHRKKSSSIS